MFVGKFDSVITREGLPKSIFECFESRCEGVLRDAGLIRVEETSKPKTSKWGKALSVGVTSYVDFFEFVFQALGEAAQGLGLWSWLQCSCFT